MDLTVREMAAHVKLSNEDPNKPAVIPKMYVKMSSISRVRLFQGVDIVFADVVRDPPNHFSIKLDKNDLQNRKIQVKIKMTKMTLAKTNEK